MLPLHEVEIRNFLSYGDYKTVIPLSDQSQCFITGEIIDGDDESKMSNGAGKSSLMQAILWCLTGRTMHNANPGSKIINWFTGNDCIVKLKFKTGEVLTRIRRRSGESELMLTRSGEDILNCTLSTTPNMQKLLNKELELDWDIFCGSVFCSQYSKAWLEMSDQVRKAALERITGIDRLSIYADIAKRKRMRTEVEQDKLRQNISVLEEAINEIEGNISDAKEKIETFDQSKRAKRDAKIAEAEEQEQNAETIQTIDIDKLKKKWAIVDKIQSKLDGLEKEKSEIDATIIALQEERSGKIADVNEERDNKLEEIDNEQEAKESESQKQIDDYGDKRTDLVDKRSAIDGKIEPLKERVKFWEQKKGENCVECEQPVPDSHVSGKIDPILDKIAKFEKQSEKLSSEIDSIDSKIKDIKEADKRIEKEYEDQKKLLKENTSNFIADIKREYADKISDLERRKEGRTSVIDAAKEKLAAHKPDITVELAKSTNAQQAQLLDSAKKLRAEAEEIMKEENPHIEIVEGFEWNLQSKTEQRDVLKKRLHDFDIIYKHLQYVYKAYSDRRRVKSYLISRHIPYFNNRLSHYLDAFKLDVKMELTESLSITSNKWGYDYLSGGERKRYDVAFMFAVLDLHTAIHGKQCNILVLDEVDGRLDTAGVEELIHIIKSELSSKFESIFIISHRKILKDVFPKHILVRRTDRFSQAFVGVSA